MGNQAGWIRTVQRAMFPVGIVVAAAWIVIYSYGFASGEFEPRPFNLLLLGGNILVAVGLIATGWAYRREHEGKH